MFAIPPDPPTTRPDEEPTVAIDGLLLLHVPPVETLLSVIDDPTQTGIEPVMDDGNRLTVTVVVVKQPTPRV